MRLIQSSITDIQIPQRNAWLRDHVSRRFLGADLSASCDAVAPLRFDMRLAIGNFLRIGHVDMAGLEVQRSGRGRRTGRFLLDSEDVISCFFSRGAPAQVEYNDIRRNILDGEAIFTGPHRSGGSYWPRNQVTLLVVPRAAFPSRSEIDAACGITHSARRPLLKLLRAYTRSIWRDIEAGGGIPPEAERHLVAVIAGLASRTTEGMARAVGPALGPARVAAMREVIARRAVEPELSMREVAAAVGISERSGHLVFADAALTFSACLLQARLEQVRRRLLIGTPGRIIDIALDAGFGDVAHFNRVFRRQFNMTPTDMLRSRAAARA